MAMEIGKGKGKGFEKAWYINCIYLWKQWKIGEKEGERSQFACEEENEGK